MVGWRMNAGRFVIDGLAIPRQSKRSTVPRMSHWPRPRRCWIGSAALLLFEPRWWGKAGARSPWIGSGPRLVRAHSQNYRPWRKIERRVSTSRVGPLVLRRSRARPVACVALALPLPPLRPVPVRFSRKFRSISTKLERLAVYGRNAETMSLNCDQCLGSVVR